MHWPKRFRPALIITGCLFGAAAAAQATPESGRAAPWQQQVQYTIHVALDASRHELRGREDLVYTNGSPDTLREVWFHAYPNAYKDDRSVYARELGQHGERDFMFSREDERGWIAFDAWRCDGTSVRWEYKPGDETEVRLTLPRPLEPGGRAHFEIEFRVRVPRIFSRLGHEGDHYEITQWYPKIVVYDGRGWHPDGYHRDGEFYGDYGEFDVWITLPEHFTVAATGSLVGPPSELARLDKLASGVQDPPAGRSGEAAGSAPGTKTLHYRAERVHDFAWFADPRFELRRGQQGNARIEVYSLPEHRRDWQPAIALVQDALEWYGREYGVYPYPQMTLVDGLGYGGMEYPTLAVVQHQGPDFLRLFEWVVCHETGHQWFYGLVGTDEMNEAWLDEGVVSYSELHRFEDRHGRSGNITRWPSGWNWLPKIDARWVELVQYHRLADIGREEPILQPSYAFERGYFILAYAKAGGVLMTLHGALGDSLFDEVMRTYVREWSFKHPRTEDFIAVASRLCGCDLNDYFAGFMRDTDRCDYEIAGVRTTRSDSGGRVEVSLRNRGEIRVPHLPVRLVTRDGAVQDVRTSDAQESLVFETRSEPLYVEIDPDHDFLEIDHWNDRWPRAKRLVAVSPPSFFDIDHTVWPRVWFNEVDHARIGLSLHRGNLQVRKPLWGVRLDYAPRTGNWYWGASVETRLPWNRGDSRLDLAAIDLEGYDQQRIGLDLVLQRDREARPRMAAATTVFRNEVHDLRYFRDGDWQSGRSLGLQVTWWREVRRARWRDGEEVRLRQAWGGSGGDRPFTKAEATLGGGYYLTKHLEIGTRGHAGTIWGQPLLQDRITLAGDLDPDRRDVWVPLRRGELVPLERWYVEGGPGMPGAAGVFHDGAHAADRTGLGLRAQVAYVRGFLSAALFGDAGNVWPRWGSVAWNDLRSDAGVDLRAGPLRLILPLYVDDPAAGATRWDWRWLVGFEFERPGQ